MEAGMVDPSQGWSPSGFSFLATQAIGQYTLYIQVTEFLKDLGPASVTLYRSADVILVKW